MSKKMSYNDLPIYCINLEKDVERKNIMQLQLINKNVKFINAIYGKNIDDLTLTKYTDNSQKHYYNYNVNDNDNKLSPNEIGCLLSHIKVYEESLKNEDEDYILVLEDDVNLISFINNDNKLYLSKIIQNYECIQLCIIISNQVKLNKNDPLLLNWNSEFNKLYPYPGIWSTGAYIISKQGRIKIIESFKKGDLLRPSDFYIYNKLNTVTILPPVILPISSFGSNISKKIEHHILSNNKIIDLYFKKKLILISVWFGKLPEYFNLWMYNLNPNYDVLFITDQEVVNYPNNLKIIFMTLENFNDHLNKKTGFNVSIKNAYKLVDVKPLLGFLFYEFIDHYDFCGWCDIDMIMGNILKDITGNYDIYSYGMSSFGPLMIFKMNLVEFYLKLENYETILNDEYICKVDEPWWFINKTYTDTFPIYRDENIFVKYYNSKNILHFLKEKKCCTINWDRICVGVEWNIKKILYMKKREIISYKFCNNKLFKNNTEISFTHLTILKHNTLFLDFINKNLNNKKELSFNVIYNYNKPEINFDLSNLNTYDTYNKFVQIEFELC
jgi:GR25 family glycosyltransferase involved in LPS biosynthesis